MNHALLKHLARKYGCLETIQIAESPKSTSKHVKQIFDYVIVIDFESTCWNNDDKIRNQPEVIEFPAVLLNIQTGGIEDEFQQYVMPTENPKLSNFCKTLTGIKQEQVDNGVPLATCLLLFSRWIKKLSEEKSLVFHKQGCNQKTCTFVTWSDWDLSTCLDNECKRKNLLKPEILNQWIDLRAIYKNFYKRQPKGLNGAMSEVGLKFEGRQHSGIVDARNTAALVYHLVKDGALLNITKVLEKIPHANFQRFVKENSTHNKQTPHDSTVQKGVIQLYHDDTPVSSRRGCQKLINSYGSVGKLAKSTLLKRIGQCSEKPDMCESPVVLKQSVLRERTPLQPIKCPASEKSSSKQNSSVNCRTTPPLCKCGRRALRRLVSVLGPNQGRTFFVCTRSKSLGTVRKSGCGFFKWE